MATVTPAKGWGPLQLGTAASALITQGSSGTTTVTRAVFTNVTGAPVALTVYVVRSGGSANAASTVISAYNIGAGEAYVSPELANLVLSAGDSVQALAGTAASITTVGSCFTL